MYWYLNINNIDPAALVFALSYLLVVFGALGLMIYENFKK